MLGFQCDMEGCPNTVAQTLGGVQMWHDERTWPGLFKISGEPIPGPNDEVTIDDDRHVVVDRDTAKIRKLVIKGALTILPPIRKDSYCQSNGNDVCPINKPCRKEQNPSMLTCKEYEVSWGNATANGAEGDMCAAGWKDCANHTSSITLKAHAIEVHGALNIGTSRHFPIRAKVNVQLHGPGSCPPTNPGCGEGSGWPGITMRNGIDLNNKLIGVIGEMNMHGVTPKCAFPQLAQTANPTDTAITVLCAEAAREWGVGDVIEVTASDYPSAANQNTTKAEIRTIAGVQADGNRVRIDLDQPLKHRHYSGLVLVGNQEVPFRSHVALVSRNVKFYSEESAGFVEGKGGVDHGAQITVLDNEGGSKIGVGAFSGIMFKDTGKHAYQRPSLYFFGGYPRDFSKSFVHGCSFLYGGFEGIKINGPANIKITKNYVSRMYGAAVHVFMGKDIVIEDNLGSTMWRHPDEAVRAYGHVYWPRALFQVYQSISDTTATHNKDHQVKSLKRNIATGAWDSGFILRAPLCGATATATAEQNRLPTAAEDANVAYGNLIGFHIKRSCMQDGGGPGACKHRQCVLFQHATAWKNSHAGVIWYDMPSSLKLKHITTSDNHIGVTGHFHRQQGDMDLQWSLEYSTILGTTDISDCTASLHGKSARFKDHYNTTASSVAGNAFRHIGIMTPIITNRGFSCEDGPNIPDGVCQFFKSSIPDRQCAMPWDQRYGIRGSRYAKYSVETLKIGFFHHKAETYTPPGGSVATPVGRCSRNSIAITYNPTGRDYNPSVSFRGVTWVGYNRASIRRRGRRLGEDPRWNAEEVSPLQKFRDDSDPKNVWKKLDRYLQEREVSKRFLAENTPSTDGRFYLSYFGGAGEDRSCSLGSQCDGMFHFWLEDLDGTLTGKNVASGRASVLPEVSALTVQSKCTDPARGSYVCENLQMALLNWESNDHDCCGWDRRELGNFAITRKSDSRTTISKHMYDDVACPRGCEFGNSFYPMAVAVNDGYTLIIPSSMPQKQKLHFFSSDATEFVVVKLYFSSPLKVRPYINGEVITELSVGGDLLSKQVPITAFGADAACTKASPCADGLVLKSETLLPHGAHVQNPQEKYFTIVLRGNCGSVPHTYGAASPKGAVSTNSWNCVKQGFFLQTVAVVQIDMKISMDINAWEQAAETNKLNFRTSIATLLGIDIGRIKIVQVTAGSVNIKYDLEEDKPVLAADEVEDKPQESLGSKAPLANVPAEMMLADAQASGMNLRPSPSYIKCSPSSQDFM